MLLHLSIFFPLCGYVITELGHFLENTANGLQFSMNHLHNPHCFQKYSQINLQPYQMELMASVKAREW